MGPNMMGGASGGLEAPAGGGGMQNPRAALGAAGMPNNAGSNYDLGDRFLRQARRGRLSFGDDGSASMANGGGFSAGMMNPQAVEMLKNVQSSRMQPRDNVYRTPPGGGDGMDAGGMGQAMSRLMAQRAKGGAETAARDLQPTTLDRVGEGVGDMLGRMQGTPYGDDSRAIEGPGAPPSRIGRRPPMGGQPIAGRPMMQRAGRQMGRTMSRGGR